MTLMIAWVIFAVLANVVLYRRYRRAKKERRAELIRRQVMESLRVVEIGPAEVINLREIIER
jgi:hypothetical protein